MKPFWRSKSVGPVSLTKCLLFQESKQRPRSSDGMQRMLGRGNVGVFWTMKRLAILSLISLTTIGLISGSSEAQQLPLKDRPLPAEQKILIVYLSRTNNTKAIAEIIHQKVGGRLVALELETPYPADYNATVQQVVRD